MAWAVGVDSVPKGKVEAALKARAKETKRIQGSDLSKEAKTQQALAFARAAELADDLGFDPVTAHCSGHTGEDGSAALTISVGEG